MRRLLHIFLFVTLLGFTLSGCRQSAAERRLVAADTLIAHGDYDSALAQLRAIDTTSLSHDELAYHGLLMAHAAYKAYDSAYLDTTWIARARQAYAEGGPYDRHIRTLLYSGCVANELGDLINAMRWFKRTELDAHSDDHLSRGYALLCMGHLYQCQYIKTDSAISKLKESLNEWMITNDHPEYVAECLSNLGQLYRLVNIDTARNYLEQAVSISKQINDTITFYSSHEALAGLYNETKDFVRSKNHSLKVINEGMTSFFHSCYYYAAQAYLYLNQKDSAILIFAQAPIPSQARDSILFYNTKSLFNDFGIEQQNKNQIADSASFVVESAIINTNKNDLSSATQDVVLERLNNNNEKQKEANFNTWVLLFICCLIIGFFYVYTVIKLIKSLKKRKEQRGKTKLMVNQLTSQYIKFATTSSDNSIETARKNSNEDTAKQLRVMCIEQALQFVVYSGSKGKSIFKLLFFENKNSNAQILNLNLTNDFLENLKKFMDISFPHAIERMRKSGISINEKEELLLATECLNMPNALSARIVGYNERSASAIRSRLVDKLGKTPDTTLEEFLKKWSDDFIQK